MGQNAVASASAVQEQCSAANFSRLSKTIESYSGIKMPAHKLTMLQGRLRRRFAAVEVQTLDAYCDYLFKNGGYDAEIVHLIDAVTTNKTDFFREPVHFDFLRDKGLPALMEGGRRNIKAWSAACSIGAEAYTLAMVLEDFRRGSRGPDYTILATDICTEVLVKARVGCFSNDMIAPIPEDARKRHVLLPREKTSNEFRIAPHLRARVSFARLNLMDDAYPVAQDMDFVFCRNILIYFDKTTQKNVLSRLITHVRPGGLLFLGHSESIAGTGLPVRPVASTIFERI